MQIYKAPINDMRFILEAFDYEKRVTALPGLDMYDLDTTIQLLEQVGKFCTNEMLALNRKGDIEGLQFDPETGAVTTPEGFKALYQSYVDNGASGISMPEEYGGGGAPATVALMIGEMATATNKSFSMCPGLTHGLIEALDAHGSDAQKKDYLPNLVTGKWSGTMCLTEPHCGTDLGLLRTRAEPQADGSYALTGTKIWITFGEHDLTENIIHLVLARLPDAPAGIKGISTFIVPKFLLDGTRNDIYCGGLEHKMGIKASPTCVMNMEGATGYLVGEPHKGMRAMFTMMNYARLTVGLEGVALADIAYQTSVAFAHDRRQSKALNPERRDKNHPADTILVHPDVRRMLANIKSTNEGMRALAYWTGLYIDRQHHCTDPDEIAQAKDIVALLTPVIKSYLTERGFQNISEAMQVTGGAGYTTDWSIEQYLRDERIALIYEGTNGIQALDLVGRKLPKAGGRLYKTFIAEVLAFTKPNMEGELAEFAKPIKAAADLLTNATMQLAATGMADPEEAAAIASNYLKIFGLTAVSFMWGLLAQYALANPGRYSTTKIKSARYYMNHVLPEIYGLAKVIEAGKADMMAFDDDEF